MDKVFVLSLHRSGGRGALMLLRALGYDAAGQPWKVGERDFADAVAGREDDIDALWEMARPVTERHGAFSGTPFPLLYPKLYDVYPDAKFLLLHRSPRSWLRAVRRQFLDRDLGPLERVQYWAYLDGKPESLRDIADNRLLGMYWRHLHEVTSFFNARDTGRLAVVGLDEDWPGYRISLFLGYPALVRLPDAGRDEERAQPGQRLQTMVQQSQASPERARFAVERAPNNPLFQRHLARHLEREGDRDGAAAANARADELEAALRQRAAAQGGPRREGGRGAARRQAARSGD